LIRAVSVVLGWSCGEFGLISLGYQDIVTPNIGTYTDEFDTAHAVSAEEWVIT